MLKGLSPLLSPDLLACLARMGHGDEIVLADAHFPGHSVNANVIRADGLRVAALLDAVLPLLELDTYGDDPVVMMDPVGGDELDPSVEASYADALGRHGDAFTIARIERHAFYERARIAFAVVMTGETAKYGNILLRKGVTPA